MDTQNIRRTVVVGVAGQRPKPNGGRRRCDW